MQNMYRKVMFSVGMVLTTLAVCSGRAANNDPSVGKYQPSSPSTYNDGKYRPVSRNEGRYIHTVQPYVHVHDNRELGQYKHIHVPYNGGYGPYAGLVNPYIHDHKPYEHDDTGKYTTTSTTMRPTTTTTTQRPRLFNYHDEGGWRILRQEEEKKKHKYDFLYLTENGIYGEEKAHLRKDAGTAASGYYEYTGDDGELYRVNYKSDERGFIPEADHIPTPPPIPDAIKRALEYNAKKKETHGALQTGHYEHKPDPVRRQNLPTNDQPLSGSVSGTTGPKLTPPPIPTLVPQARFLNYDVSNQYNPLPTGVGSEAAQNEPLPLPLALVKSQPQAEPQQQAQPVVEKQDQLQQDQPQQDQPQQDQPQQDQPQQDQPQQDQPQSKAEEQSQQDQPQSESAPLAESIEIETAQETASASERYNANFQAPEQLKNEDNFELATA